MNKYLQSVLLFFLVLIVCITVSSCSRESGSDKISKYNFLSSKKQNMLNEYSNLFSDASKNSGEIKQLDQKIFEITKQLIELEKDPKVKEYVLAREAEQNEDFKYIAANFDTYEDSEEFGKINGTEEAIEFDEDDADFVDLSYDNLLENADSDFDGTIEDADSSEMTADYDNNPVEIEDHLETSSETDDEETFDDEINENDYQETI